LTKRWIGFQNNHCDIASNFTWTLGAAKSCNCSSILDAIATLIESQRLDLAIVFIKKELNSQT
jgi:hypothetical protein